MELRSFLPLRFGKPEALTAAAIVTKEHASSFIPFNETTRRPEGSSCGMCTCFAGVTIIVLNDFDPGGVEKFQADYAFISWAGGMRRLQLLHIGFIQIVPQLRSTGVLTAYWSTL
jgi:hypothetical protein